MANIPIVWHYTVGEHLTKILTDGEIRPATTMVAVGEKPAVWFSLRDDWEPTANKLIQHPDGSVELGTKETTHENGGGLARIGVAPETAPHDWQAFKRLSGVKPKVASALYNAAIADGASPRDWRVSFSSVPISEWLAIEVWDGENWRPAFVKEDR